MKYQTTTKALDDFAQRLLLNARHIKVVTASVKNLPVVLAMIK